jgi:hypothetical protein
MTAQGGPPPGWPAAPAGAYGPGFTQTGEPGFSPSFPPHEGADGVPMAPAPPQATVVDQGGQLPPFGGAPAPVAYPAPAMQAYVPPAAPPKSKLPLIIGIGAILVGSTALGAFFYTRQNAPSSSDSDTSTPAASPKKAAPAKTAAPTSGPTADAKADTPTMTEAPPATAEPPAPTPTPQPKPVPTQQRPPAAPLPQPQPQPQPTQQKPPPATPPPPQGHGTIPLPHH